MRIFGLEIRRAAPPVKKAMPLTGVDDRGWHIINESFPGAWQRGITIDQDAVVGNWTVFSCMTLIAGDIGKMDIMLMEEVDGIDVETESPAFSPVLRKPNKYQTSQKFYESWMLSKLSTGNTYVLKVRDNRGVVTGMHILDPARVKPLVAPNGDVYYQLHDDELAGLPEGIPAIPASEIIHDRMWCLYHPLVGLSPIFACGLAATQGLKIQGNSAKFFENMSRPSGILTAPEEISDETAARLKAEWQKNYGGDKIGGVAVLGDGLKYEAMSINPVDAQMVEQLKLSAEMICSVFHVPAYKVGVGASPTYQNAEILNQIYYEDCLQVQIEAIEALLDEGLGTEAAGYCTEFDLDDLMRMDSATQIKTLNDAVGGGWMSPNEARYKRNLPPVTGGETPYLQQQNYSLEALARRDAKPDPFAGATQAGTPAPQAPAPDPAEDQVRAISDRARDQVRAEMAAQKQAEETAMADFCNALKLRLDASHS
jgi:HK97 family phage portal protein